MKLQSVAMMESSKKCLLEDEIEQSLLEELTAVDQSSCSDDDDSSGTDDLTVVGIIGWECNDNESDDLQCATASSAPTAASATLMWEDMMNYVGQSEQFVDNYGPQNKAQNETYCAKVFKMWMDNFYNSPALAQRLKSLKTDCVGTLCLSRKDFPQRAKEKKLKKGELVAQHSGLVSVLKWKDKKRSDNDFDLPWRGNKNEANKM